MYGAGEPSSRRSASSSNRCAPRYQHDVRALIHLEIVQERLERPCMHLVRCRKPLATGEIRPLVHHDRLELQHRGQPRQRHRDVPRPNDQQPRGGHDWIQQEPHIGPRATRNRLALRVQVHRPRRCPEASVSPASRASARSIPGVATATDSPSPDS